MGACHYGCGTTVDLRPYGPGGALVCYPCAMATAERKATTDRAMGVMMDAAEAASPVGGIVLDEDGFHPATGRLPAGAAVRDISAFVAEHHRLPSTPDEVDEAQA